MIRFKIIWLFFLTSLSAFAQQNFFNVPSSDITPTKKLFFQQQMNFFRTGVQSNTTFSYGLGRNYEIGVNLLGFTQANHQFPVFSDKQSPYAPLFCVNAQKRWDVGEHFGVSLGGQFGTNRVGRLAAYTYSNAIYANHHTHTKLVAGLYYSTNGFFGTESRNATSFASLKNAGVQLGMEQKLWKDKLFFQCDYISGKHSMGETVVGLAYWMNKKWVLSSGYSIPNYKSTSLHSVIVELTYVPS